MKRSRTALICFSLCLLTFPASSVLADVDIIAAWFTVYGESTCDDLIVSLGDCTLCHSPYPALNVYGEDMQDANNDPAAIGNMDSDGDGRTNDEEITNDCTMPGDVISAVEPMTWSLIKALYSHP